MKQIISPHIDDAFLSLGGSILNWIEKKEKIKIIHVFSKSNWTNPNSLSAKKYTKDIETISNIKKREEEEVSSILKTKPVFLDYIEKIPLYNMEQKDIIKKVKKSFNKEFVKNIENSLTMEINKRFICFFPLSTEDHPSHRLVNDIGLNLLKKGYNIQFYEDFPYISRNINKIKEITSFRNFKLIPILKEINIKRKLKILKCYKSQISVRWLDEMETYAHSLKENKYYERYWKPIKRNHLFFHNKYI
jgi:LmbE family N-acetylglucosaminyl deacetylase